MSKRQDENVQFQPREGQRLLSKRQQVPQRPPQAAAEVTWVTIVPLHGDRLTGHLTQVTQNTSWRCPQKDSLEGRYSLLRSGTVTRPKRLSVSDLPPLHGPPLTVTPPCRLSSEMPRAASARVKLPPLPAAPAASGAYPRGRALSMGPVASSHRELVPPSRWGTVAAHRARGTPSLDSSAERLWRGSAARQGHHLPPLRRAGGMLLRTGTQPDWKHLGHSEMEELIEVQEQHSGNIYADLLRSLALCLYEDTSTRSTCTQAQSSVCQDVHSQHQVVPSAPGLTKHAIGETGKFSKLLSPAQVSEQQSVSDNSQSWDTPPKEPNWQEEELPVTEAAGDKASDPQGTLLALLKEKEGEPGSSTRDKDPWDEGNSKLLPTSEPEVSSDFTASPSSGRHCEERGAHQLPEHTAHGKLLCTGPEDASKHPLNIDAEELEKLEEDILSSLHQESPSVPHSLCGWSKDSVGETENYTQLVPPDRYEELWSLLNNKDAPSRDARLDQLLAKWEEEELHDTDTAGERDSESQSSLSLPLQDAGAEPEAFPLHSDPCDEEHRQHLPMALPEHTKMFAVCASPADPAEEADAAWLEAGCAQAAPPQEEPHRAGEPAGACPLPAQPLARSAPACPAGSAAVPQPPAPRPWRSIAKTARRALRRLFSFSCLRGQRED
ncbi:uncharacterized protein LOC111925169 isoform X1 [Cyanistes caeruleus]|uniref:uncharacterized protein LOC111925169 isoform X1 n=1 Tax=Cyanistes caeruleus TaxID=156563 RepID=UPI000CDA56D4|nr:uncharacterized protein LOC111925169 isoform X1 [Cyanistes caeruleus]